MLSKNKSPPAYLKCEPKTSHSQPPIFTDGNNAEQTRNPVRQDRARQGNNYSSIFCSYLSIRYIPTLAPTYRCYQLYR